MDKHIGIYEESIYDGMSFSAFKEELALGLFRFGVLEDEPMPEGWKALVVPGARVQMAYGCPPQSAVQWEGDLVGRQRTSPHVESEP